MDAQDLDAGGAGSLCFDSISTDATFLEPIGESAIERTANKGLAPIHLRLQAMMLAARYHGIELNPAEFPRSAGEEAPAAAALSQWAHHAGMWSCACAGATCCGSRMGRRWSCCSATAVPHF